MNLLLMILSRHDSVGPLRWRKDSSRLANNLDYSSAEKDLPESPEDLSPQSDGFESVLPLLFLCALRIPAVPLRSPPLNRYGLGTSEDHRLSRRSGTGAEPRLAAGTYRSKPSGIGQECPRSAPLS